MFPKYLSITNLTTCYVCVFVRIPKLKRESPAFIDHPFELWWTSIIPMKTEHTTSLPIQWYISNWFLRFRDLEFGQWRICVEAGKNGDSVSFRLFGGTDGTQRFIGTYSRVRSSSRITHHTLHFVWECVSIWHFSHSSETAAWTANIETKQQAFGSRALQLQSKPYDSTVSVGEIFYFIYRPDTWHFMIPSSYTT